MNFEFVRLFVDMEYLNQGLVPWSHYHNVGNNDSLFKILQEMTPDEQRKAKRKFRKVLKKECKRRGILKEDAHSKRNNIVYSHIFSIARKKIDSLKANDS